MKRIFMPTDRVGLENIQGHIPDIFKTLNMMRDRDIPFSWHLNGLRFSATELWPEGHYYQSGFSFADTAQNRALLEGAHALIDDVEADELPPGLPVGRQKIAFYVGRGTNLFCHDEFHNKILPWGGFQITDVDDRDIRSGKLAHFDTLIVPGSPDAGECYYMGLGDRGYDNIRAFLAEGGSYLGVCGGAYFPLTPRDQKRNPYWLGVVNATDDHDLDYWCRGPALARLRIVDDAHPCVSSLAVGALSTLDVVYWEGPVIKINGPGAHQILSFQEMAYYGMPDHLPVHDLQNNEKAKECLYQWANRLTPERWQEQIAGHSAFIEANYHKGKLILCSHHPEFGNHGATTYEASPTFLLLYNSLLYLSIR